MQNKIQNHEQNQRVLRKYYFVENDELVHFMQKNLSICTLNVIMLIN